MAPPSKDEMVKAFIDLVSDTRDRTSNLPNDLFPVINTADIERISLGEATMIPLLCTLLASVHELRSEVSVLRTGLEALDTHTRVLPTISQLQEVVGDKVTAPLASTLRDLSHRVAGSAPAQTQTQKQPLSRPPASQAPPTQPAPTRQTLPNPAQSTGMDLDIPRYDTSTKIFYGNPEAYANKFPTSWEANAFREGKYPPLLSFVPGNRDPSVAGPAASHNVALGSYASAARGFERPGKKSKKRSLASGANQVAALSRPPFGDLKRKTLPGVKHRFFASRSVPAPHPKEKDISATFPDIVASLLRSNNCDLPLGFTVKVNSRGALTVVVSDVETPAAAYAPFFDAITSRLNQSFPVGESPWLPFRLAPNEAQVAIHSLPISYLPSEPDDLFDALATSVRNARGVSILSARFLNPNPSSRQGKLATSVAISVRPQDVPTMGSSIRLFSGPRKVTPIVPANRFSLCDNCCQFGHVAQRCTQEHPTCPLCSLHHRKSEHRCPNPVCPKGGNTKPVLACCEVTPAKCANCGEPHSARYCHCVARPVPTAPPPPPQPAPCPEEEMDTAEDPVTATEPPVPARILFPDAEPTTPRADPARLLAPQSLQTSVRFAGPPPSDPVSPTTSHTSSRASAH